MEQYEIRPGRYFENIKSALKHFKAEWVYIRFVGSHGGGVVVSENLKNKKLVLRRRKTGLDIIIDGKKVFFYETTISKTNLISGERWAVAYERIDRKGRMHYAHCGYPNYYEPYTGPDDSRLPEAKRTIFRSANGTYLIEITFSGKIPIKKIGLVPGYKDWHYWELDF